MEPQTASRTALVTALMRSLHTRLDPRPLINDPWGDRLVPASTRDMIFDAALARLDAAARAQALSSRDATVDEVLLRSPAYSNVIMRTRYTEDALEKAVERGVQQYVLIGAGFDSFALRRPPFARDLEVFEIDHPATQALKLQRIRDCGLTLPPSVHFIAADLSQESVAGALSRSPFAPAALSFFSWLGVTMYLTQEANLATFRSIASCSPAGSLVAFTYMEERTLQSQSSSFQELQQRVSSMGEPFLSGFDPVSLGAELRRCGLELIEDVTGEEAVHRYHRLGTTGFQNHSSSHLALARRGSVVSSLDDRDHSPRAG
jgi:methyltransferase (TIGR00027 family)